MIPNTGSSGARATSGPEARMSNWPASAGCLVPDTGASTNRTSGRASATMCASCSVACTPMVAI